MKIFDCFMFFDEEQILDLRLNVLNKTVDFFVIVESIYNHKGEKRELVFDIKKFSKFKKKIIYLVYDKIPENINNFNPNDTKKEKDRKYIYNAVFRENAQRNYIMEGLNKARKNDIILVSDIDEIPKLSSLNFEKIKNEIIVFNQDMFHYKYNLVIPNFKWGGTRAVRRNRLISPQWLRNVKVRKYPIYRVDTLFSKKKYTNLKIIEDGGWHFSNIKTPEKIVHKYKSYLHHWEFEEANIGVNEVKNLVDDKKAIYNLKIDQRDNKIGNGEYLENFDIKKLPDYIQQNISKYEEWLD